MSDHTLDDTIDWDDPIVQQAVRDAQGRYWQSKLIHDYWFFLCASKIFIGAPKVIPMSLLVAQLTSERLHRSLPIWHPDNTECLPR